MLLFKIVFKGSAILLLGFTCAWSLPGTSGAPLGGIGTGYVKFNGTSGDIAALTKIMPAASLGKNEFGEYKSSSCGLHFFVAGKEKNYRLKNSTPDENAILPIYSAIFSPLGGVTFADTSFGPIVSGQAYDQLVHSPLAYFDVTARNTNGFACTVAVALEFSNLSTGGFNLLGGPAIGASDGDNAISWEGDTTNTPNGGFGYMKAGSDDNAATYSSGAMGSFTTDGALAHGAGNIVAAKSIIPAGGTAHFRFVMSWWRRWILTPPSTAKPGAEDHYYQNFYKNAKECAQYGMERFPTVRSGAISIVKRTMASNFPEWYKERLLNNTYTLQHNSVAAKDGRVAYWEGQYSIIGTIDQNEHAALWYVFNWPQNQWRELQFWARSAYKTGKDKGQIHHDVNGTTDISTWRFSDDDINHFMFPWDNSTHLDYSFQPNTRSWMDLNCMFIFKAYELMLATGDRDSVVNYWDSVKNTANRIINFCLPGEYIPNLSLSSYDSRDAQNYTYPCGTSLTAWLVVIEMAKWLNDQATVDKYTKWYKLAREDFTNTYARLYSFGNGGDQNHPEGDVAGYSWARYFGLEATIDSFHIARGCRMLWNKYKILPTPSNLGVWHFYQYDHMGGALTAIGRPDSALQIHKWDYDYFHAGNPTSVYWQDLWNNNKTFHSYCTAPGVWRSLFQFTGTLLDNANHRMWIRPVIPSEMKKTITNAPLIGPRGWGTLNFTDSIVPVETVNRVQFMQVDFDSLTTIKEIVLKWGTSITVPKPGILIRNNGPAGSILQGASVTLEGSAFERNIRITLVEPIQVGTPGLCIKVYNGDVPETEAAVIKGKTYNIRSALTLSGGQIGKGSRILFSVPVSGITTLELFQVNGAKIGTIATQSADAGSNSFLWNGMTMQGVKVNSPIAVLRLNTGAGSISRTVHIRR